MRSLFVFILLEIFNTCTLRMFEYENKYGFVSVHPELKGGLYALRRVLLRI